MLGTQFDSKVTTAQVVETSVAVNKCAIQDFADPNDHTVNDLINAHSH